MRTLLVSSFFGFILLYLTTSDFAKELVTPEKEVFENPLDRILGEKKLENGTVRPDNFDSILKIKASFLKDSSGLYTIKALKKDLFLVSRKKFFNDNRFYSLFVKTKGDLIVFYHAINDFTVKDAIYADNKIYLIGDEYTQTVHSWKATLTLKITCLDLNFKEVWNVVSIPYKGYYCYAKKLNEENHKLAAIFEVQGAGSSTMCTSSYRLILNKSGNPESQNYLGGYSCGPASDGINVLELVAKVQ